MGLLQLPTELFEAILQQAILARGIRRGLRLRLINKLFAKEVKLAMYRFHILDDLFGESVRMIPGDLTRSYLAYRIAHEPAHGNCLLRCMKEVAEILDGTGNHNDLRAATIESRVYQILPRVGPRLPDILQYKGQVNEAQREHYLFAAALQVNNAAIARKIIENSAQLFHDLDRFQSDNLVYGRYDRLAAAYAGTEILECMMTHGTTTVNQDVRMTFFLGAARAGRADVLRYVYDFKRDEAPWYLAGDSERQIESKELHLAQNTHSIEVLKFIVELRETYPIWSKEGNLGEYSLDMCVYMGCLDTVKYALELGAHPKGELGACYGMGRPRGNAPVLLACVRGHTGIVECLLAHGAGPERTVAKAADWGHLELVRRLLELGAANTEALSKAAFGGYLDIVRFLLDSGVDANESIGFQSPLAGAIAKEHTAMFNLLIERGANLYADGVAEECVRRAKKDGLDSMLQLLQAHGVDTQRCTFENSQLQW